MTQEIRQFYVVRVDDHKPISGEHLAEVLDADEVVYVIDRSTQSVIFADVFVRVEPQLSQCA